MLQASIQQLNTQLIQNAVILRKKELDFYLTWIQFMLFCAAIIFVNGLNAIVFPTQDIAIGDQTVLYRIAYTLYIVSNALASSLEFAVITCALYASLLGPGLALRGPAGSMDRAVESIKLIISSMFKMFIGGLVFAQLSLLMYFWVAASISEWPLALVLNILVLAFSAILVRKALFVYRLFWFDSSTTAATGLTAAAGNFAAASKNPSQQAVATTGNSSQALLPSPSFTATARPQNTFANSEADAAIGSTARPVKKKKGLF